MLRSFFAILLAAAAIQPLPPPYLRQETAAVYSSAYEPADWTEGSVLRAPQ